MVHWISTDTLEIIDNTLVDSRPRGMTFTQDSEQLWVTSEMGGTLSVLDVATRKIIKKLSFTIPGVNNDSIQPVGVKVDKIENGHLLH